MKQFLHESVVSGLIQVRHRRNNYLCHLLDGLIFNDVYQQLCDEFIALFTNCVQHNLLDKKYLTNFSRDLEALNNDRTLVPSFALPVYEGDSLQTKLDKSDRSIKSLTRQQLTFLNKLWDDLETRYLIQSPPGSGKTLLCVHMALRFLLRSSATQATQDKQFLVLVHSPSFAQFVADEIINVAVSIGKELSVVHNHPFEGIHTIYDSYTTFDDHSTYRHEVHVMGVDTCIRWTTGSSAISLLFLLKQTAVHDIRYAGIAVDEGHLVFSYQPNKDIGGQHMTATPSGVSVMLASVMANVDSRLVVFHDEDYQHSGTTIAYPLYCIKMTAALPIVRNPGSVRDLLMMFSRSLAVSDGRQSFYPLLGEGKNSADRGPEVKLIDTQLLRVMSMAF